MDSATWPETLPSDRFKAIHELTQGQELTTNLREMLRQPRKIELDDGIVLQVVAMFENTLSILDSCAFNQCLPILTSDLSSSPSSDGQKSENSGKSVGTIIPEQRKRGCYKRRKKSWTSSQVTSTLIDDGHAWRKYGQKHIQNAKHERSYYRCTYKFGQGCFATKQVQKIRDNPPQYKTTYLGNHTCMNLQRAPQIILDSPNHRDPGILLNFETKGFIAETQLGTSFPCTNLKLKQAYPSEGNLRDDQYSYSSSNAPYGVNTFVSHIAMEPISKTETPLGFDNEDMISSRVYSRLDQRDMISSLTYTTMTSTYGHEMDHMTGINDFNDFPSSFCF